MPFSRSRQGNGKGDSPGISVSGEKKAPARPSSHTVGEALLSLLRDPGEHLIRRWNWKSALTSSLLRAPIFFFVNLTAGRTAAVGAFCTELGFRSITSGFYGSIMESLREAEPGWMAGITVAVFIPAATHSMELLVHWLRGTPKLTHSIMASVCFTFLSTLFNFYVMRRGAYIVGENRQSLTHDLRSTPRLLAEFLAAGPRAIYRWLARRDGRRVPPGAEPGWQNEGN